MSWLSGIVSGTKALFGGSSEGTSNVMKVASGIGNFIDEQQFTDEERAQYRADMLPAFQTFMDSTVSENTERSITRRRIAIWVIRNWFAMLWVAICAYGFELVIDATAHQFSEFVFDIATLTSVEFMVLGVGGFFFGSHIIRTGMASKNPK